MLKKVLGMLVLAALCAPAMATIQFGPVTYQDGDTELEGFMAYDDAVSGTRPAVLVVHEWWGLTEHAKESAKKLAELGYNAFALDMYGKDKYTDDPAQAKEWSGEFKADPMKAIARFKAGMDVLRTDERTDPRRMAAIGYCFGGTMALEMARMGFAFRGVVSFHGGLAPNYSTEVNPAVVPHILVCHGANDPFVSVEEVSAFEDEMRALDVDWQLISYGGAVHSFTNPAADGSLEGAKYDKKAAERSWEHMKLFLAEVLK